MAAAYGLLAWRLEAPARRPARVDGGQRRGCFRGEAVDVPGRRPGRGRAELGGERHAGVVDPGRPASGGPARGHVGDGGRVGDQGGLALDDQVELLGREAHGAARITGEVPALTAAPAGLEPEAAVGPQRTDAVDMRASVRVDRGQPAGMTVRSAGARHLGYARTELGLDAGPVEQRELVQVGKVDRFHSWLDDTGGRNSSLWALPQAGGDR